MSSFQGNIRACGEGAASTATSNYINTIGEIIASLALERTTLSPITRSACRDVGLLPNSVLAQREVAVSLTLILCSSLRFAWLAVSMKRLIGLKFNSAAAQSELKRVAFKAVEASANGGVGVEVEYDGGKKVVTIEVSRAHTHTPQ